MTKFSGHGHCELCYVLAAALKGLSHLGEVTAGGGGIEDGELEALVRADDKNSARCQWNAGLVLLVRVQHSIPAHTRECSPIMRSFPSCHCLDSL